ncbi:hypothetical protein FRB90_006227, partial [Tulasnella sp. 427]
MKRSTPRNTTLSINTPKPSPSTTQALTPASAAPPRNNQTAHIHRHTSPQSQVSLTVEVHQRRTKPELPLTRVNLVFHVVDGATGLPWDIQALLSRGDTNGPTKTTGKRTHDLTVDGAGAAVDGFFRDMKKRKYVSSYDAQMAERLSALSSMAFAGHRLAQQSLQTAAAYGHNPSHYVNGKNEFSGPNINPALSLGLGGDAASAAALAMSSLPSQALPSTPEELAIVNQFLVRLGEQIAAGNIASAQQGDVHHHGAAPG